MLQSILKGDLSTLQELTSTGKSGSFFYYSADGRFTLKTIHKEEYLFLRSILVPYYEHLKKYPNSLLIKFFGLHKIYVKQANTSTGYKIYFIIMSNVFHTPYEIHQRYDLKGSLYKRSTPQEYPMIINSRLDWSVARKDLDFLKSKMKL
jgi:1-phosphatidylinositol-4-phosphate 5-kinase